MLKISPNRLKIDPNRVKTVENFIAKYSTLFQNKYESKFTPKSSLTNNQNQLFLSKNLSKLSCTKYFSTANHNQKRLTLMNLPRLLIPNVFELIRIRFKIRFLMFNIDSAFKYKEFSHGSLQAAIVVSQAISRGDFGALKAS